jgi:1-acyl-sn-glycerol-3-phosphate acyltransferase
MKFFFVSKIIRRYFRLEIEGLEHLPQKGPALIVPNHSGYAGFDALILAGEIRSALKRIPRILAHHLWFVSKPTSVAMNKMGIAEATMESGLKLLQKKNMVILFPEGEYGNFKPSKYKYKLQEFKRGFVRMAIQTSTPIVPCLIIGAEETHITISQLRFTKYILGTVLPLPLNLIPLPAKWKIVFLEPILLNYPPSATQDRDLVTKISRQIRDTMQFRLNLEVQKRNPRYGDF